MKEAEKQILVIGAGPAGMMAAITAARAGAKVTLLEGMERAGKKLLLTGNGRCNLTHEGEHPEDFCFGAKREWIAAVMQKKTPKEVCTFFEQLGLLIQNRDGYLYPVTGQASSVLSVLLAELKRLSIKIKYSEKIQRISYEEEKWKAWSATWCYEADALILACGSRALPSTGSDGSGYQLAKMSGHSVIRPRPALTAVTCREAWLPAAAGTRCRARVSLQTKEGERIAQETGELQWTAYGVSGILIFQLSRYVSEKETPEAELTLSADLLPDYDKTRLYELFLHRAKELTGEPLFTLLTGILPEKLIPVILAEAGYAAKGKKQRKIGRERELEEQINALTGKIKQLVLIPTGTKSFDACQVCAGGVDTKQVNEGTLESKKDKNLFFAGEILDVDGLCGGYNLQWAWASGFAAGQAAADCLSRRYPDDGTEREE